MSEENVTRSVTLVLPKKVNDFFESFAKSIGVSVEEMFREELLGVLSQFYQGGFIEKWLDDLQTRAGEVEKLLDC